MLLQPVFGKLSKNTISRNYKTTNKKIFFAKELVENVSLWSQVSQSIMDAITRIETFPVWEMWTATWLAAQKKKHTTPHFHPPPLNYNPLSPTSPLPLNHPSLQPLLLLSSLPPPTRTEMSDTGWIPGSVSASLLYCALLCMSSNRNVDFDKMCDAQLCCKLL